MGVVAVRLWMGLAPYQQNRILSFLNPEIDPRATGWNIIQSKVAIGSGGMFGKGFMEGTQKRLAFLPAQHTDFIFPVVAEEFGFRGVIVGLALFTFFFLVLIRIALCHDSCSRSTRQLRRLRCTMSSRRCPWTDERTSVDQATLRRRSRLR